MRFRWLSAAAWCVALDCSAQQAARETGVAGQGAYMVQVLVGLLVVLGMIFAMGWLLRRVGQGTLVGSQQLKILASLSLGTREKIALVQVGEQQLLLGITPNNINTLQSFSEPVIDAAAAPQAGEFATRLKAMMARNTGGDGPVDKQ